MLNLLWISLAFGLVLLNAFFVAAEFGLVKLRQTRVDEIKKIHRWRGGVLKKIHHNLDAYLSACQLGITLASLGLGWVGEPAFVRLLQPLFLALKVDSPQLIEVMAFTMAFTLISFLHIVLGELVPKSLAIRQSEAVSIWTSIPLYAFYWMMYPLIWLLNSCSNLILTMSGLGGYDKNEHYYSTEEIQRVLKASHHHGELTKAEAEILEHTLEFADLQVTEIMRPYEEMVYLDTQQTTQQQLQLVTEQRYSRYPVYDGKQKDMIGLIHVKDLFSAFYQQPSLNTINNLIRPILKISHQLPALHLLHKFQQGTSHFALVYMKENLLGFVTLDNLLHILIGRVQDEFHNTQDDWLQEADDSLLVKGKCSIYALERALGYDINLFTDEEELDTIAGLIVNRLGYFPDANETFEFDDFKGRIVEVKGALVLTIKIEPKKIREDEQLQLS